MIKLLLILTLLAGTVLKGSVRYGSTDAWDNAGHPTVPIIESTLVYKKIPAYQTIIKENIRKGSARYTHLMLEATNTYKSKLRDLATKHNYIIIVEKGGVVNHPVKNITLDVISLLNSTSTVR
jgi:hypothetical protein